MPNIKSAKKRVLVNAKKRERNRSDMSEIKTAIRKFNEAIETNHIDEAEAALPKLFALLDSAASKGVIHKNNAANKKSQSAKRLNDVKTGKIEIVIKKDNKTIAAEKAKLAKDARDAAKAEYQKAAEEKKAKKAEADALAQAAANEKKPKKAKAEKAEKPETEKPAKKPAKAKAEKPEANEAEAEKPAKKPAKAKAEKTDKPE